MFRALSALAVASLAAFVTLAFVPTPAPGGGAILAMHHELFRALDAADAAAAQRLLSADLSGDGLENGRPCTLFLVAEDGVPASAIGNTESRALLARLLDEQKALGGSVVTRITKAWSQCPSSDSSWAVLEFERTHTKDGAASTRRYRSTSIVRHDDAWKLTAWHVSPADARASKVAAAK